MTSQLSDRPVSALRARMIEDMRVRGFSEKTRNDPAAMFARPDIGGTPTNLRTAWSPTARATRIRLASIVGSGYTVRKLRYFRPVRPKETRIHKWDQQILWGGRRGWQLRRWI